METMRSLVSLVVCLCALSAQEPSKTPDSAAPQPAIRARTQEVLLDMVVRDKKGVVFDGIVCHKCKTLLWSKKS